jgi:methionine synthase I (cobalamin-dependent)
VGQLLARRRSPGASPRRWDGAIGSELIALGLELSREPPEAWTLSRPEELRRLHRRYLEAGAEVIQTNTFGGSRPRLARAGLDGEIARVNRAAVAIAREAGAQVVVASLGPTGIEPFGDGAAAAIEAAIGEQVALLEAAGVDGLHFETLCHPVEAAAAIAAARAVAPRLPVIASTTVALGDHGFQTPYGIPLAKMAAACTEAGADALGVNCSLEARKLLGAARALREATELPILLQPQGGEPSVGCRGERRGDTPERFARDCLRLVDEGVDAIGGCCGAGPDFIAELGRSLDARFAPR